MRWPAGHAPHLYRVLDGAEWHGVAVHVIHGNMVFGIIGLTSAETFQFQEAIFNKIIRTFHFLTPADSCLGPRGAVGPLAPSCKITCNWNSTNSP